MHVLFIEIECLPNLNSGPITEVKEVKGKGGRKGYILLGGKESIVVRSSP